jgi:hypothetical protein
VRLASESLPPTLCVPAFGTSAGSAALALAARTWSELRRASIVAADPWLARLARPDGPGEALTDERRAPARLGRVPIGVPRPIRLCLRFSASMLGLDDKDARRAALAFPVNPALLASGSSAVVPLALLISSRVSA